MQSVIDVPEFTLYQSPVIYVIIMCLAYVANLKKNVKKYITVKKAFSKAYAFMFYDCHHLNTSDFLTNKISFIIVFSLIQGFSGDSVLRNTE